MRYSNYKQKLEEKIGVPGNLSTYPLQVVSYFEDNYGVRLLYKGTRMSHCIFSNQMGEQLFYWNLNVSYEIVFDNLYNWICEYELLLKLEKLK